MSRTQPRQYWIVKHGYDALTVFPNYIWRTGEAKEPESFRRVRKGDRWIGFAYTTSDARERPLSAITGFYECVNESRMQNIPWGRRGRIGPHRKAWMIKGRALGWQPRTPVGVPSIDDLLERTTFKQTTFIKVSRQEFAKIRAEVKRRELDPHKIPLLGREPRYEQEVLAVVARGHEQIGIEKILRVRTAFPDLLVKLRGKAEPVHLELEVYSRSFLTHGHAKEVKTRNVYRELVEKKWEERPLAVLCWIDDAGRSRLRREGKVDRVFELQSLIRDGERIRW